jgi:hypothetical protein
MPQGENGRRLHRQPLLAQLRQHGVAIGLVRVHPHVHRRLLLQGAPQREDVGVGHRLLQLSDDPLGQLGRNRQRQVVGLGVANMLDELGLGELLQRRTAHPARLDQPGDDQRARIGRRHHHRQIAVTAQHAENGFGDERAVARAELLVLAKERRQHGVGGTLEVQHQIERLGGELQQGRIEFHRRGSGRLRAAGQACRGLLVFAEFGIPALFARALHRHLVQGGVALAQLGRQAAGQVAVFVPRAAPRCAPPAAGGS